MTLEELRIEIDHLNIEMLKLLSLRVELTRVIAQLKKEQGLPIEDLSREEVQLMDLKEQAARLELQPQLVEELFSLIVSYSKKLMEERG